MANKELYLKRSRDVCSYVDSQQQCESHKAQMCGQSPRIGWRGLNDFQVFCPLPSVMIYAWEQMCSSVLTNPRPIWWGNVFSNKTLFALKSDSVMRDTAWCDTSTHDRCSCHFWTVLPRDHVTRTFPRRTAQITRANKSQETFRTVIHWDSRAFVVSVRCVDRVPSAPCSKHRVEQQLNTGYHCLRHLQKFTHLGCHYCLPRDYFCWIYRGETRAVPLFRAHVAFDVEQPDCTSVFRRQISTTISLSFDTIVSASAMAPKPVSPQANVFFTTGNSTYPKVFSFVLCS